jgi:mono/diheme cytochrome c family protein
VNVPSEGRGIVQPVPVSLHDSRAALTPNPSPGGRGEKWDGARRAFFPSPSGRGARGEGHPRTGATNRSAQFCWAFFAALVALGCQQQMADQPSYKPLDASEFFPNGQSARPLVAGTVARGHLDIDWHLYTGRIPPSDEQIAQGKAGIAKAKTKEERQAADELLRGKFVDSFPFPVTLDVLQHGYHRFMIYCVVCHDPLGTGRGKIVQRGYTQPPSYHIPRLREVPVGHIFAVISEGYGSMPSYGEQIPVRDRWAVAAYVRALQLSQHFPTDRLTPAMKAQLKQTSASKGGS